MVLFYKVERMNSCFYIEWFVYQGKTMQMIIKNILIVFYVDSNSLNIIINHYLMKYFIQKRMNINQSTLVIKNKRIIILESFKFNI